MTAYPLPAKAQQFLDTLHTAGYEAYAVGGSIRDLLMGKQTQDWDFTTNATPDQILNLFPEGFYNNVFGTVGVPIKDQRSKSKEQKGENEEDVIEIYEITTYRTEHGYSDKRRPDKVVWGSSLQEDLARRDFTVNAIAYDGKTFIDPFDGQKDIEKKFLRAVGNPDERFKEDALRLMRAVRFAAQLSFIIEEKTFQSIVNDSHLISAISQERIHDELLKIMASPYPADGVMLLRNSGLLKEILPEVDVCFDVPQESPKRHHKYDVGTHLVKSLEYCPSPDPIVRFATLIHDIGKAPTFRKTDEGVITFYNHELIGAKMAERIVQRLRFSKKDGEKIVRLVRWHQFTVDEHQTDSALRRFIKNVGKEHLEDMLALRTGDRLGGGARETSWRLELYKKRLEEVQIQPFSVTDLKVNGNDVMEQLHIKPGPTIGKVLNALFAEVEEDKEKNNREYLLKRIPEINKL